MAHEPQRMNLIILSFQKLLKISLLRQKCLLQWACDRGTWQGVAIESAMSTSMNCFPQLTSLVKSTVRVRFPWGLCRVVTVSLWACTRQEKVEQKNYLRTSSLFPLCFQNNFSFVRTWEAKRELSHSPWNVLSISIFAEYTSSLKDNLQKTFLVFFPPGLTQPCLNSSGSWKSLLADNF